MSKYICPICGFIYDEAKGIPEAGIPSNTSWEQIPTNWTCPLCGAAKADFILDEESSPSPTREENIPNIEEEARELSNGEISILCSSLAKGCEKQYLNEEMDLFNTLSAYYQSKAKPIKEANYDSLLNIINKDLSTNYISANTSAESDIDRGAKRALLWSEKVTKILSSILIRYNADKDKLLDHTNIYVCEICGFIFIGDVPPAICPVCKVPNKKMTRIDKEVTL
ncbi:MAG: rubredoxin [Bacilli bacterium]